MSGGRLGEEEPGETGNVDLDHVIDAIDPGSEFLDRDFTCGEPRASKVRGTEVFAFVEREGRRRRLSLRSARSSNLITTLVATAQSIRARTVPLHRHRCQQGLADRRRLRRRSHPLVPTPMPHRTARRSGTQTLRWRLWHTPARVLRKSRRDVIRLLDAWPDTDEILAAYQRIALLT